MKPDVTKEESDESSLSCLLLSINLKRWEQCTQNTNGLKVRNDLRGQKKSNKSDY